MKQFIHTASTKVIERLGSNEVNFVLTEPFFSYRHPLIQTEVAFLALIEAARPYGWILEINGYLEDHHLSDLKVWLAKCLSYQPLGVAFADFAVYELLNELTYEGERIYAPETILTNVEDVGFYLSLVDRVVLAKELTLQEMVDIAHGYPQRVEILAMGYPMMSVSKRPLVQNYLDEIQNPAQVLNRLDLRIQEHKRLEWMHILEEKLATSIYAAELLMPKDEMDVLRSSPFAGLHYDDLFIEEEDFIRLMVYLNNKGELGDLEERYSFGSAYFYRKTNLTKEEVSA